MKVAFVRSAAQRGQWDAVFTQEIAEGDVLTFKVYDAACITLDEWKRLAEHGEGGFETVVGDRSSSLYTDTDEDTSLALCYVECVREEVVQFFQVKFSEVGLALGEALADAVGNLGVVFAATLA